MKIQIDVLNSPTRGDQEGFSIIYDNVAEAVNVAHSMCAENNPPYAVQISLDGEHFHDVKLSDFV